MSALSLATDVFVAMQSSGAPRTLRLLAFQRFGSSNSMSQRNTIRDGRETRTAEI